MSVYFFFFNDTATTEIYTLSLHDALPILRCRRWRSVDREPSRTVAGLMVSKERYRSEEHTSELQSQSNLVCRLLLEKKKNSFRFHSCLTVTLHLVKTLGLCEFLFQTTVTV